MEKLFQHKLFPWIISGSIVFLLILSTYNILGHFSLKKQMDKPEDKTDPDKVSLTDQQKEATEKEIQELKKEVQSHKEPDIMKKKVKPINFARECDIESVLNEMDEEKINY